MLQRMLQQGAKRLAAGSFAEAGDAAFPDNAADWTGVEPPARRAIFVSRRAFTGMDRGSWP